MLSKDAMSRKKAKVLIETRGSNHHVTVRRKSTSSYYAHCIARFDPQKPTSILMSLLFWMFPMENIDEQEYATMTTVDLKAHEQKET